MARERSLALLELPVDAQASILAFLSHGDMLFYSRVSQRCCSLATMDRLWSPLLARHFSDVDLAYLRTPLASLASQFRLLL
jgi:hypothetical protein